MTDKHRKPENLNQYLFMGDLGQTKPPDKINLLNMLKSITIIFMELQMKS